MTEKITKYEKYFTQQWTTPEVAQKLKKSSIQNPEFNVLFEEKEWHEDGDLVKIRLTFKNCGKNIFTQRLFNFLIRSLNGSTN
jgi:hypothetical protein